jgi:hypothetical protein
MLEELLNEEQKFQPYLLKGHYTFIGPENQNLLGKFIEQANLLAPIIAISRTVHHALSHKNSTINALQVLPPKTKLRIYIVIPTTSPILFHSNIEEYCNQNNILYP